MLWRCSLNWVEDWSPGGIHLERTRITWNFYRLELAYAQPVTRGNGLRPAKRVSNIVSLVHVEWIITNLAPSAIRTIFVPATTINSIMLINVRLTVSPINLCLGHL